MRVGTLAFDCMRIRRSVSAVVMAAFASAAAAQGKAVEATLPELPKSLYFVMAPKKPAAAGRKNGLIVVLPGGNGSRDFLPWVENALLAQRPDDCAGVLVTSVKWQRDQETIWPTKSNPVPGMEYTTEQYVRAVVAAVEKDLAVDPVRRVVVAWSSSGPAIHPLMAVEDGPFARAYIAMSVWPRDLVNLAPVKARRYVLDQSPEDQTTTFSHVREAYAALTKAGAVVRLSTYAGGHGWHDEPLPRFKQGLTWLLGDEPAPPPVWPPPKAAKKDGKLVNQLANGGFEQELQSWNTIDNSGGVTVEVVKNDKAEGKQALHLKKVAAGQVDLVVQSTELAEGKSVVVSVQLKSQAASNAWVKLWLYDKDGKQVHDEVDVVKVPADTKWKTFKRDWPAKGAVRATLQILMVGSGELWVDDAVVHVIQ